MKKAGRNNNILKWIAVRAEKTRLTASVCTGSSLLGKSGLLDGHEATTHWCAFDFLRESAPRAQIRETRRQPYLHSCLLIYSCYI
jgi:transcriptional regulator GlxA family with amidase domain